MHGPRCLHALVLLLPCSEFNAIPFTAIVLEMVQNMFFSFTLQHRLFRTGVATVLKVM